MLVGDLKSTDFDFIPEKEEQEYEEKLKKTLSAKFLQYLALKIALVYSKKTK